jgi:hypothetical protein
LRPNYLVDATVATVDARRAGNGKATWKKPAANAAASAATARDG